MKARRGFRCAVMFGFVTLISIGEMTSAIANFSLDGIVDNGAGDSNPSLGIITVSNLALVGGTGTFSGSAVEVVGALADTITLTGTVTGSGSLTVMNDYNAYNGPGYEFVTLSGSLLGPSQAGAFLDGTATSSTFSNNSAFTTISFPNAIAAGDQALFGGANLIRGNFTAPGVLVGTFDFSGEGGTFSLPAVVGNAAGTPVPEPSSICLVSLAIGLVVVSRRARARFVLAS